MILQSRKFDTARARWLGIGPYYAMFPAAFCDDVIQRFTRTGDLVLDPFAGRGTAVFSAASLDRCGLGIEVNPVGWIYGKTKLTPAPAEAVLRRLHALSATADRYSDQASLLPQFFTRCFHKQVRQFLIAARQDLDWKNDAVDRTLMTLILVNLHGKRADSLSNQMRQTKAMAPAYAIRWWKERKLKPPKIVPTVYLQKKIAWRYAKGVQECVGSEILLGDSAEVLPTIAVSKKWPKASLLLTSPPYFGITNYHYDQWLRLWVLGGKPSDAITSGKHTGKFQHRKQYELLLHTVFGSAATMMSSNATVYVRTDRREPTYSLTIGALKAAFPEHTLTRKLRPFKSRTQTALFGHFAPKFGEVDLIMRPS